MYPMSKNSKGFHYDKADNWIGVGVAIGAAIFALTHEPVWIALGVSIGAALGYKLKKDKN